MNAVERIAILDAKSGQRVHVEESPVIDFACCKLPVSEPVVLSFQQVVKGFGLRRIVGAGPVDLEALIDSCRTSSNSGDVALER